MRCPNCGTENRESARFCDNCGAALAEAAAPEPSSPGSVTEAASAISAPPPPPGSPETVGGGRYEVFGFLGEGTRKRVYLARDSEQDGSPVAVSVFSTEGMGTTAQVRARREAEAMATLGSHAHVVSVLSSGQDGSRPFIASEYMPGGDLDDALEAAPDRRVGVEQALAIATDIAAGLEHAHSKGIVHRDIKPANVWLDADGRARLGDFGLAAHADRSREAVEGMVVGTAAYLPPEQAIGRRTDERADLYSLGAVLYELLTGEPPFEGDDPVAIISRHLSAEPVPPSRHSPEVPAALDRLVADLLAKSPDDRPASAAELRARLERISTGADGEAGEDEGGEPANPLEALAGGVFVGREAELEALRELIEGALAGRGGIALLEGEPGIGKTRLIEELVTYARVRGAAVLSSSCQEADAVPAYWPFAEMIRSYVRDVDPVGLAWQLGADGPEIARLVPELRELVPSIAEPPPIESDEARFRFFEAVTGFLSGLGRSKPLLIVIDDLHWSDPSSLELLRFFSHRLAGSPLLLACAYRQEEAEASEAVRRTIAELDQAANRKRLALAGLDAEAIGRYLDLTFGSAPEPGLVAEIHEQTGGNPFFVAEVVRLMASEGGLDGDSGGGPGRQIPHGVREAVGRRLERLPAECREALTAASVVGREFDPEVLALVVDGEDEIGARLRPALSARIVERRRGSDRYLFSHAVFREALYDELGSRRRAELHGRAGEALESLAGNAAGDRVHALAHHFGEAGPEHAERALDYSLRAGRDAAARLAHADAAAHLERALELLPGDAEPAQRMELSLDLAEEMIRCGRFIDAREVLTAAATLAREAGDGEALARVGIVMSALSETGSKDTALVSILEEALSTLGEREPATRARLLSALALEFNWEDVARAAETSAAAVALAREAADDGALSAALAGAQFVNAAESGSAQRRLDNAEELLEVSTRCGDRNNEARAHAYRMTALLQLGEIDGYERAFKEFARVAEELREPRHLWHVPMIRAGREIMRGNFSAAGELSNEGLRLGNLAQEPLSTQFNVIQLALINTAEGKGAEMLPTIRRMVERYPAIPAWRLALVGFLVETNRHDEARVEFEPIAAAGFERIPRDANWLTGMSRIGEAAAALGDTKSCESILEMLEPHGGEVVVVGRGVVCNGPVERYRGLMAAALGDHERAIGEFETANAVMERMGERPLRISTRHDLAKSLLARDRGPDRDRAIELLGLVLEEGQELGMRTLVERAVRVRLEAQGVAGVDVNASIDSVALAVADERPDLGSVASADGRVTILFSDIENSTLMTERLGDERWIEVLRDHNSIFRRRLAEHGGYEVKNQGDGFMLAFGNPVEALRCAGSVQRDLEGQDGPEDERIRVRMGMHVGEAIEEEGDFFGRSVILAARIAAQARGGEILVSDELRDCAGSDHNFDDGRELELKGLAGTHVAYAVRWESQPEAALA